MHAAPRQRVQNRGKRGHQRFAFARLHFGDFAFVQNDAADQLHVEMAHAELPAAHFAHQGKRRNQSGFQRFLAALLELRIFQRKVAEPRLHLRPELRLFSPESRRRSSFSNSGASAIDCVDQRLDQLQVALMLGADEPGNNLVDHGIDSHHDPSVRSSEYTSCSSGGLCGPAPGMRVRAVLRRILHARSKIHCTLSCNRRAKRGDSQNEKHLEPGRGLNCDVTGPEPDLVRFPPVPSDRQGNASQEAVTPLQPGRSQEYRERLTDISNRLMQNGGEKHFHSRNHIFREKPGETEKFA